MSNDKTSDECKSFFEKQYAILDLNDKNDFSAFTALASCETFLHQIGVIQHEDKTPIKEETENLA